jgi:hypothetical protein
VIEDFLHGRRTGRQGTLQEEEGNKNDGEEFEKEIRSALNDRLCIHCWILTGLARFLKTPAMSLNFSLSHE